MGNKLYEEDSIKNIANAIRQHAPVQVGSRSFYVSQMATFVGSVASENRYKGKEELKTEEARTEENVTHSVSKTAATVTIPSGYYAEEVKKVLNVQDGDLDLIVDTAYDDGLEAGIEYIKTEEGRDSSNISYDVYVKEVEVNVDAGYYQQETVVNVDVTSVYDEGHTKGYNEGYNDGLADGGGGGADPLLEEMLIVTDEEYEDEGKQFYSVYKWLGMYHSNFSSFPWMLELENEHPTLWLHVYVQVNGKYYLGHDEETGESFYERATHSYVLTVGPDYGVNSIEEDEMEVTGFYIDGVRWSTDGV